MLRIVDFLLLLTLISSSTTTDYEYSAASPAQIKFAEENNYDSTGPGAKEPEPAFNTFNNLEDALLSYFDDPDTKLPEQERIKALTTLYRKGYTILNHNRDQTEYKPELANDVFGPKKLVYEEYPDRASIVIPKMTVPFVPKYETPEIPNENSYENEYAAKSKVSVSYNDGFNPKSRYTIYHSRYPNKFDSPYKHKLNKIHAIKANPVNLAHYSRDTFEPSPQYSYSYAVQGQDRTPFQDQLLDSTRPRGVVGYYTYMDPEGRRRTVQYRADNRDGFRSNVDKYFDNK